MESISMVFLFKTKPISLIPLFCYTPSICVLCRFRNWSSRRTRFVRISSKPLFGLGVAIRRDLWAWRIFLPHSIFIFCISIQKNRFSRIEIDSCSRMRTSVLFCTQRSLVVGFAPWKIFIRRSVPTDPLFKVIRTSFFTWELKPAADLSDKVFRKRLGWLLPLE